ncbi:hypothetical protein P3T76_011499 [Phytophthora citrophthora]|uniref:Uncharacterized protein n=1 Tax=Phytophthora citrophthora TaxID=4793 RepID=A0AAD9LFC5_9STRA|nr:hypothetical protein P3T76_011499 [Phytophthora citrophthora]
MSSSESPDPDRCDGESSNSGIFQGDTGQENEQWLFSTDSVASEEESDSGSWLFDTLAGPWTFVSLTPLTAQVALDAVRYQRNYARSVSTRLCLHYVNNIRTRVISGVQSYLFSVDGCELSQVEPTGRCDIYYCRPYTYELQLTQKTGSTVFAVQSIYKTVNQKSLIDLRGESNLDFVTAETGLDAVIKQADTIQQNVEPALGREELESGREELEPGLGFIDDEQPIAWTNGVNSFLKTEKVAAQSLSLRAEPRAVDTPEPEIAATVGSGSPGTAAVAVVGIIAVAVSIIAFVVAFIVVRWRARRKETTASCAVGQEYSPLRSTLNTTENLSVVSRDSGAADPQADIEKVEFFGLSNDTAPVPLVVDDMELEGDATGTWTFMPLTLDTAQVALDAVRYQSNYARTVTLRLCLHYINIIRKRVSNSIISYLFSVDGCELSEVEATGRCDIYYCRPYTYEVQLVQKAVGSDVFMVQSIYKTVDQKTLDEYRAETSNLDFITSIEPAFHPSGASIQTMLRQADEELLDTSDLDKLWEPEPIPTQKGLSLHGTLKPLSLAASQTQTESIGSAPVIAIVGIATVAVSAVAFVVAFALVRWRARANTENFVLSNECSPLSCIPKPTENTLSISSRESIASDVDPDVEQLTGFFI